MYETLGSYSGTAIKYKGVSYSYDDLCGQILDYKNTVSSIIKDGNCVVLNSDYSFYSIALFIALSQLNIVIVPIIDSSTDEYQSKIDACQPNTIIKITEKGVLNFEEISETKKISDEFDEITKTGSGLVLFSSGTTGKPKTMLINLNNLISSFKKPRKQSKLSFLVFLLFDHIGGLNTLLNCLNNGSVIVIPTARNPSSIIDLIFKDRVNVLPTSPTFLNLMLLDENFDPDKLSSIKLITYGTERMPETLLKKINMALPRVKLMQTFGTSETGILKTTSKSSDSLFFKIDDPDRETKVINGELFIRSKTGIKGYLDHDNSNFMDDGWFATGDLVEESEDGYLRVIGRKNDVINVGGLKVMPSEIENVINLVDGVIDASVYGAENIITGNMVCCKIVKKEGYDSKALKVSIRKFCKLKLESYKIPSKFIFEENLRFSNRFKKL